MTTDAQVCTADLWRTGCHYHHVTLQLPLRNHSLCDPRWPLHEKEYQSQPRTPIQHVRLHLTEIFSVGSLHSMMRFCISLKVKSLKCVTSKSSSRRRMYKLSRSLAVPDREFKSRLGLKCSWLNKYA